MVRFQLDELMSNKEDYTPDEWHLIREAFSLTSLLVMIAGPSPYFGGAAGLLKETNALHHSLTRMLSHGAAYPLIDDLRRDMRNQTAMFLGDDPEDQAFRDQTPEQAQKIIVERCRQTSQILFQKADPVESAYYKKGLLWVCAQVARAANEHGGLLGSSESPITDGEREVIRQVAFAFGLPATESLVEELPAAPRRSVPAQLAKFMDSAEWQILRDAPLSISSAVLLASPNGIIGTIREVTTLVRVFNDARERYPENRLIDALVDDLGILATVGGEAPFVVKGGLTFPEALERVVTACQQAVHLLQNKVQASGGIEGSLQLKESEEFKHMLVEMTRQVAESAREGGFLGIGSRRISAEEQTLIETVSRALDLPEP